MATLEQRPLADHRAGSDLGHRAPSTSTASTPSSSTYMSLPAVALFHEGGTLLDRLNARLHPASHDAQRELPLQRGLHLGDQRGRILSPQACLAPKASWDQRLKSTNPDFWARFRSRSYTQWHGNGLAPMSSCEDDPSTKGSGSGSSRRGAPTAGRTEGD